MHSKSFKARLSVICLLASASLSATPALARADAAAAIRSAPGIVQVSWQAKGSVDLYLADRADADITVARLLSSKDSDGHQEVPVEAGTRPYFLIKDRTDGTVSQVAERLIPLEQGSNFRDIGGYATASGQHVRWGRIYRSGATPMLNETDLKLVSALGLRNMIDLRSDEERQLAPSRIDGVPYTTIGYSMMKMLPANRAMTNGVAMYHNFPVFLAPQLRLIFADLLRGDAPLAYNCSAGQDRTGFATAMILSALGVPRETIIKDYLLSTGYRNPSVELPRIDPALYPNNPVAQMFAHYQNAPGGNKAQPLMEADGTPFLTGALAEIDAKWGSSEAYLKAEVGLSDQDLEQLRKTYVE